jgi:hypothetical protein
MYSDRLKPPSHYELALNRHYPCGSHSVHGLGHARKLLRCPSSWADALTVRRTNNVQLAHAMSLLGVQHDRLGWQGKYSHGQPVRSELHMCALSRAC